jgi:hypothetical protein
VAPKRNFFPAGIIDVVSKPRLRRINVLIVAGPGNRDASKSHSHI